MATDIPQQYVPTVSESEALVPEFCPNVDHLITEDDTPADNLFSEKQQRLLTEALHVDQWLRWTDLNGQLIATGAELASIERERAEKLSDQLRRLGVSPEA